MGIPRRNIPAGTQAALWALSSGRCYAPGCVSPIVLEVRPGVYRKNVQVAHIVAVSPGAPRYLNLPGMQRDSFSNLILLCLAHHAEVDDRTDGDRRGGLGAGDEEDDRRCTQHDRVSEATDERAHRTRARREWVATSVTHSVGLTRRS